MAEQLNDVEIKMGTFIPVNNAKRRPNESNTYYAIKVEDEDGNNERWLLYTRKEIQKLSILIGSGWKDSLKAGRLYKLTRKRSSSKTFIIRAMYPQSDTDYVETVIQASERWLNRGLCRAANNKEDIPDQSWISDLLD